MSDFLLNFVFDAHIKVIRLKVDLALSFHRVATRGTLRKLLKFFFGSTAKNVNF